MLPQQKPASRTQANLRHLPHNMRGVSMISVLLGLVVSAVLIATIFNQFNDSRRSARIDEAVSQITTIIGNAQKSFGAANQYATVTNAISINSGVIPDRMRTGTAAAPTAHNVYNQPTTLVNAGTTGLAVAGDGLLLTYPIRGSDCLDVVQAVERLTRRIQVGTNNIKPLDGAFSLANANTQCGTDPNANIAVVFAFGRS